MNYFLWRYITNPHHRLTENLPEHFRDYHSIRALVVPAIFICMLAWYLFSSQYAIFIPPLIPLVMFFIGKYYKKKFPIQEGKAKK